MNIAILGAGAIGQVLTGGWIRAGHDVTVGVRNPRSLAAIEGAHITSIDEAVADETRQVIVFAIPDDVVPQLVAAHRQHLTGKVVIDPTVRFGGQAINNRACFLDLKVSYVRAFSTYDPMIIANPIFDGQVADLFFAASDEHGREVAHSLIGDLGLRPVYVGGDEAISVVDGITRLWFALAVKQGHGDRLAFRTLSDSNW